MNAILGLVLVVLLSAPVAAPESPSSRTPVLTTPHFAFFSDFDTNLNDALIEAGRSRKGGKAELFKSGAETGCFGELAPSARAGWNGAVDYYAEIVSPADWTDKQQYLIRVQLAGFEEELTSEKDREYVEIVQGMRAAAAPAYRACRWSAQDAKNRRWIEELKPLLSAHEDRIASRLAELYEKPWAGLPIPVDVVEVVNWAGANSILRDGGGGHLLISSGDGGNVALETVFHEASHTFMARGDPVRVALENAASKAGVTLPRDLWHVVLLYTTGEVVRAVLAEAGQRGYTMMVYGIFDRGGGWTEYRSALENAWRPYVDGKASLPEAAANLIDAIRTSKKP